MSMNVGGIDPSKIQALFAQIDKNCDGKVDAGEIKEAGYEPSIFNIPDGKQLSSVQFSKIVNSNQEVQASLLGATDNKGKSNPTANQDPLNKSIFDDTSVQPQQQVQKKKDTN